MAVAPAAGAEIPVALLYAVGFAAFIAYAIARGLLASWTHTLGYMLQWLSRQLTFHIPTGFGHIKIELGGPFSEVDNLMVTALQAFSVESEHLAGNLFHGAAEIQLWIARELYHSMAATYHWAAHLVHVHVPTTVRTIVEHTVTTRTVERVVEHEIQVRLPSQRRLIAAVLAGLSPLLWKALHAAGTIALPSPWAFPRFRHWAADLARWQHLTGRRLRRLEELLAASGLALAVARMLGVPNYRCLTRGNLSRVARALCGMDKALLDLFLIGTVEAFVAADLCDFARLLTAEAQKVVPALLALVDVENALLACSGVSPLAGIGLPALSLPATPAAAALPA